MLRREEEIRDKAILEIAEEIVLAVRTAPKTRGHDKLSILIADGDDLQPLAAEMEKIFQESDGKRPSFGRDGKNVLASSAVLLVAVEPSAYGLNCGWCGSPTCAEKPAAVPCAFGGIDLGIGAGVAAALLSDNHIDNRMMFSIGVAALRLGWFGKGVTMALGFPLSVSGKNPFFDRK